jgi:Flp pilus assembly pilin Flp
MILKVLPISTLDIRRKSMKKIKKFVLDFLKDESGQGTAEYVLILVAAVAVAVAVGPKVKDMITKKMDAVSGQVDSFNP